MADIHPTAIVDAGAQLAADVQVGPYCIIGPEVSLAAGVRLVSHVVVAGRTSLGSGSIVYPFASIGHPPQDLKYAGEPSTLTIGRNNVIREHVTMNPGTTGGGMKTVVGDDCLFMVGAHVAHDCVIGNHVVMANNATIAGHVVVGDHAILGGLSAVHQFVRVGAHAMIGGMSGVEHDVVPFGTVIGDRARLTGVNLIGMRRRGFARNEIDAVRQAYRMLFEEHGNLTDRLGQIASGFPDSVAVRELVAFLEVDSSRALSRPRAGDAG